LSKPGDALRRDEPGAAERRRKGQIDTVTATILLIRHAAHGEVGRSLSGRLPGLELSAEGRAQAECLAARLATSSIDRLHASPMERAQQTAQAIAGARPGLQVETVAALDELDFGDWSGRAFVELDGDPQWSEWNDSRSVAVAPNGESMRQVQERAWTHLERTALAAPGATIAMVSHCDVIRAVVAQVLDLSLDRILRFEVDPASVTRIAVGTWGGKLLSLNEGL
jgi:ribonuclease H / adenosylcobalamin/alpha-ribazole phosphatase